MDIKKYIQAHKTMTMVIGGVLATVVTASAVYFSSGDLFKGSLNIGLIPKANPIQVSCKQDPPGVLAPNVGAKFNFTISGGSAPYDLTLHGSKGEESVVTNLNNASWSYVGANYKDPGEYNLVLYVNDKNDLKAQSTCIVTVSNTPANPPQQNNQALGGNANAGQPNANANLAPQQNGLTPFNAQVGPPNAVPPVQLKDTCSASPLTGKVGDTITYTANISGGTPPYTTQWSNSDTPKVTFWGTDTYKPVFNSAGSKTVTLTITDKVGATLPDPNCPKVTINENQAAANANLPANLAAQNNQAALGNAQLNVPNAQNIGLSPQNNQALGGNAQVVQPNAVLPNAILPTPNGGIQAANPSQKIVIAAPTIVSVTNLPATIVLGKDKLNVTVTTKNMSSQYKLILQIDSYHLAVPPNQSNQTKPGVSGQNTYSFSFDGKALDNNNNLNYISAGSHLYNVFLDDLNSNYITAMGGSFTTEAAPAAQKIDLGKVGLVQNGQPAAPKDFLVSCSTNASSSTKVGASVTWTVKPLLGLLPSGITYKWGGGYGNATSSSLLQGPSLVTSYSAVGAIAPVTVALTASGYNPKTFTCSPAITIAAAIIPLSKKDFPTTLSCSSNPSASANVGDPVTWTVNSPVSLPSATTYYTWSGQTGTVGSANLGPALTPSLATSYSTTGPNSISVSLTNKDYNPATVSCGPIIITAAQPSAQKVIGLPGQLGSGSSSDCVGSSCPPSPPADCVGSSCPPSPPAGCVGSSCPPSPPADCVGSSCPPSPPADCVGSSCPPTLNTIITVVPPEPVIPPADNLNNQAPAVDNTPVPNLPENPPNNNPQPPAPAPAQIPGCAGYYDNELALGSTLCKLYDAALEYAKTQNFMTGNADGTFGPSDNLQRDQIAKIALEIVNKYVDGTDYCNGVSAFPDVPLSAWSAQYLCDAKDLGIVTGYLDSGLYMPSNPITNSEFVSIMTRVLKVSFDGIIIPLDASKNYQDVPSSAWYVRYAAFFYKNGLIAGEYMYPGEPTIRIDAAQMIYMMHLLFKKF